MVIFHSYVSLPEGTHSHSAPGGASRSHQRSEAPQRRRWQCTGDGLHRAGALLPAAAVTRWRQPVETCRWRRVGGDVEKPVTAGGSLDWRRLNGYRQVFPLGFSLNQAILARGSLSIEGKGWQG